MSSRGVKLDSTVEVETKSYSAITISAIPGWLIRRSFILEIQQVTTPDPNLFYGLSLHLYVMPLLYDKYCCDQRKKNALVVAFCSGGKNSIAEITLCK